MVNLNKNILRSFLIASYIVIIALIVSGVSALFAYLNTGADRSAMLHTEIRKIDQYLPKITWTPILNEGRPMDSVNLKTIENDYLDAWYVKHIAYQSNLTTGIEDYYTDNARLNLYRFVELNSAEDITVESTTLEHHPTLEFFSEDGQMVVITDNDVIEYKRLFKKKKLILETTEKSTYKVIMLLEDGFWRIRHLVKETSDAYQIENSEIATNHLNVKGINYYPQDSPWDMYGNAFSKDTIGKDFKIIKSAGLNTVRIFVPYEDFGKADISNDKLDKLEQTLDVAEANNLKVIITLFDFYGDYSVLDWTLNMHHAETIVSALKDHNALLAWDIKNEPDLDFKSRGKDKVISWLDHMINLVKSTDKNHPVTIGWSNTQSATILKDRVDFVTFHYYEDLKDLKTSITTLSKKTAHKTLVMGEFGISSYSGFWRPFGNSDKDQADYHKKAQDIIADTNLQYISWTLYDFTDIPKDVVGRLPWRKNAQKEFGFINKNGAKKESFKYISRE
ncbi:glycosyl hydrolase family 5 [Flavobacteriales bacterium 33_180_T64]|nr:glycosyl hydrolase family 5 [Flavobacteriales bacterium 33_180_T64]